MSLKPPSFGVKTTTISGVDWRLTPPSPEPSSTAPSWSLPPPTDASSQSSFARPPHYHESLFCSIDTTNLTPLISGRSLQTLSPALENDEDEDESEEGFLDSDLSGVKAAQETILSYEMEAGFYEEEEDATTEGCERLLEGVRLGEDGTKDRYSTPPIYNPIPSRASSLPSGGIATIAPPRHSALPSPRKASASVPTPRAQYHPKAAVGNLSPSPPKKNTLNAGASSFVPQIHVVSFPTSSPSPELDVKLASVDIQTKAKPATPVTTGGLSFPSIDLKSQSPAPLLKKDGNGFYLAPENQTTKPSPEAHRASTPSARRHSTNLLPPFLGEPVRQRKVSRTRSIVDSIRSAEQAAIASKAAAAVAASITPAPSNNRPTSFSSSFSSATPITNAAASVLPSPPGSAFSSPEFNFFQPRISTPDTLADSTSSPPTSPEARPEEEDGWLRTTGKIEGDPAKAKRTRELFTALSRHRSESLDQLSEAKDVRKRVLSLAQSQASHRSSILTDEPEDAGNVDLNSNTNDGWLAPNPVVRQTAFSCATPPLPGASSFFPPMTPFGMGAVPYTAAMLVQMQLQVQMRQLMQARTMSGFANGAGNGGGVPSPLGGQGQGMVMPNGYSRVRQMSESGLAPTNLRKNRFR